MHSQINEINAEIKEINRGNNEIKIIIKNKDHIGMLLHHIIQPEKSNKKIFYY